MSFFKLMSSLNTVPSIFVSLFLCKFKISIFFKPLKVVESIVLIFELDKSIDIKSFSCPKVKSRYVLFKCTSF